MDIMVGLTTSLLFYLPMCFSSRNLALLKSARSDSVLEGFPNWNADNVVDGDRNQNIWCGSCLHTDTTSNREGEAYLEINLEALSTIERVEIYYKLPYTEKACYRGNVVDNARLEYTSHQFKGYSIRISDGSRTSTCYTDTSRPYPDLYQNNSCFGIGRYLSIIQTNINDQEHDAIRPVLELCEVEVYGCPVGYYGPQCDQNCAHCLMRRCHPDTGICLQGCDDGWTGAQCNKICNPGFYGRNCSMQCGHCFNDSCNNADGFCKQGCMRGYDDTKCNRACSGGRYGYNCNMTCGRCRFDQLCNRETGICPNQDCDDGYFGQLCNQQCGTGTFGRNCEEKCGACKQNIACDRVTGHCESGCSDGWIGNKCQTACRAGFYGTTCTRKCSGHCFGNVPCHHVDGSCLRGCTDGYKGSACMDVCSDGWYGEYCSRQCSKTCFSNTSCHHVTGYCLFGCTEGFGGLMCSDDISKSSSEFPSGLLSIGISLACACVAVTVAVFYKRRKSNKRRDAVETGPNENEMSIHSYEKVYDVLDTAYDGNDDQVDKVNKDYEKPIQPQLPQGRVYDRLNATNAGKNDKVDKVYKSK